MKNDRKIAQSIASSSLRSHKECLTTQIDNLLLFHFSFEFNTHARSLTIHIELSEESSLICENVGVRKRDTQEKKSQKMYVTYKRSKKTNNNAPTLMLRSHMKPARMVGI